LNQSPAIVRRWERILVCGCTHGYRINPEAWAFFLKFSKQWDPHTRVHLGDFIDNPSLRSGAAGTSDEGEPIKPDIQMGLDHLEEGRITHLTMGNHDLIRIERFCNDRTQIVKEKAIELRNNIIKNLRSKRIQWTPYDVEKNWIRFGNYRLGHGFAFGLSYLRTTSLSAPRAVVAHAHVAGIYGGPGLDGTHVIGVGTLSNYAAMDYARMRFNTLSWSEGIVWGEYTDDEAKLYLWQHDPKQNTERRLPI
jgi:predicted phosphodiesterase